MSIKRFGKQAFLNHPNSASSGFVKFNITPDKRGIGFSSECMLADCSERISLEFEPRALYPIGGTGTYSISGATKSLTSIERRRAKVKKFRDAVIAYTDALNAALDEMQRQIDNIPSENLVP